MAMGSTTFIDIVCDRAALLGDRIAYRYLLNGTIEGESQVISYHALAERAKAIAVLLSPHALQGEAVLIAYPSGLAFIEAFLGAIFAGAVPVPVQTPKAGEQASFVTRFESIANDCGAKYLLTADAAVIELADSRLICLDIDDADADFAVDWRYPEITAADPAFLQYTSGSTRQPRGVRVLHKNLLANCSAITQAGFGSGLEDLSVSWMPPYHDMGLVGGLLCPLYASVTSVLLSPQAFIRDPLRWLRAISHFAATSSGGPTFAYDLLLQRSAAADLSEFDLSRWRVAYCGAEPVRLSTLSRFAETFKQSGFNRDAFLPCYGMAEATLFVSGRQGLAAITVDRTALAHHGVVESTSTESTEATVSLVCCGTVADETELLIVDPETQTLLADDAVGEIWLRGPGVADGYLHPGEEDRFHQHLQGRDGFIKSGDLGFIHHGELYVSGRLKDLIIIRGQNIYPHDIEATVEGVDPAIVTGSVAAFSVATEGDEQLLVMVGLRNNRVATADLELLSERIKQAVTAHHDLQPHAVLLVRANALPKTSSGKIRRARCRELWQQGELTLLAEADLNAAAHPLYVGLRREFVKLDRRNTHYQFDLEKDIDWHRLDEPGRYLPDSYLMNTGIDLELLKQDRAALKFYDWAIAVMICSRFVALEEAVLDWGKTLRAIGAVTRSAELLDIEEQKHIALFRRYAEHLIAQNSADGQYLFDFGEDFLSRMCEGTYYESETEYHYTFWLIVLFFEEYTIWFDEVLLELGDAVQPSWKQAHYYHRREETQHVLTDYAYIKALDTTEALRKQWSEKFFTLNRNALAKDFIHLIELTEAKFPYLQGRFRTTVINDVSQMLQHRQFKLTRAVAPFSRSTTVSSLVAVGDGKLNLNELESWLRTTLAAILQIDAVRVDASLKFNEMGLDSLGYLNLAYELEKFLGCPVSSSIAHHYPSIDALMQYISDQHQQLGGSRQPIAEEPLAHAEDSEATPARYMQQHYLAGYADKATPFFLHCLIHFDHKPKLPLLREAIAHLVNRHESFRLQFKKSDTHFQFNIIEPLPIAIEERTIGGDQFDEQLYSTLAQWNQRPFACDTPPLWRLGLFQAEDNSQCVLVWFLHHLVADAWSNDTIRRELLDAYHALLNNHPIQLPPIAYGFSDFCRDEQRLVQSDEGQQRLRWWIANAQSHQAYKNMDGAASASRYHIRRVLPQPIKDALVQTAQRLNCGVGTLLLTLFAFSFGEQKGNGYINYRIHNRNTIAEKSVVGLIMDGILIPRLTAETPLADAVVVVSENVDVALRHYLPTQYLSEQLILSEGLTTKQNIAPSFNYIPFLESSTRQEDMRKIFASGFLDTILSPWTHTALFAWWLKDGVALYLSTNENEE
ncbi:MAG: AMP-binding protein, partial [Gammaproteobacteria bacterium]|nr:AMP-binding protein [Gammaproteobacteria bacterium]